MKNANCTQRPAVTSCFASARVDTQLLAGVMTLVVVMTLVLYKYCTCLYDNGHKIPKRNCHRCSSQLSQDRDHVRQHVCDHNSTSRENQRVLGVEMDRQA